GRRVEFVAGSPPMACLVPVQAPVTVLTPCTVRITQEATQLTQEILQTEKIIDDLLKSSHRPLASRTTAPYGSVMPTPTTKPLAASFAAVLGFSTLIAAGPAGASPAAATKVTRAALDPSLVAGRGADLGFAEQEAENAVTVRYSIPDAPAGGGVTAPLEVSVNGHDHRSMTLTSQYAWLYNEYPFSNDPAAGPLHPDWWTTECGCVPDQTTPTPVFGTPFRPNHFYDEQRLLLGRTYRAGDVIRLSAPAGTNAATTTIDLM